MSRRPTSSSTPALADDVIYRAQPKLRNEADPTTVGHSLQGFRNEEQIGGWFDKIVGSPSAKMAMNGIAALITEVNKLRMTIETGSNKKKSDAAETAGRLRERYNELAESLQRLDEALGKAGV